MKKIERLSKGMGNIKKELDGNFRTDKYNNQN
jgi:hypothetical protein